MQRLILLRHGKAETVSPSGGDFERGLTMRGRKDATLIGKVLFDIGFSPDLALVSAARRAQETWAAAFPAFPSARAKILPSLYLASSGQLARAAAEASDEAACLMIVGHNPGLHELALSLFDAQGSGPSRNPLTDGFPTAAAAVFKIDLDGKARFEQLLLPRQFGGGGL